MTEVSQNGTIAAPRAAIWDVLTDFGALATWADGIDHSSLLHVPGDDLVGQTRRVQMGRTTLLERIVHAREPEVLAYTIQGLPKVVRHIENRWHLAPAGDAATQVTLTTTIDTGPRPPQQLVARLIARRIAKVDAMLLDGLTIQMEGPRRG